MSPLEPPRKPRLKATRRVRTVDAVQCRKDNAGEVNTFLSRYRPKMRYVPGHGGWQLVFTETGFGFNSQTLADARTQVWVGSWLVDIPETRKCVNVSERDFAELYR